MGRSAERHIKAIGGAAPTGPARSPGADITAAITRCDAAENGDYSARQIMTRPARPNL